MIDLIVFYFTGKFIFEKIRERNPEYKMYKILKEELEAREREERFKKAKERRY